MIFPKFKNTKFKYYLLVSTIHAQVISKQQASSFLRHTRDFQPDRERECIAKKCSFQEVLGLFNSDKSTAKNFWEVYITCRHTLKALRNSSKRPSRRQKEKLRKCINSNLQSSILSENICDYSQCSSLGTESCSFLSNGQVTCHCKPSFFGENCSDSKSKSLIVPVIKKLSCETDRDCLHGDCNLSTNTCFCYPGYKGPTCTEDINE